MNILEKLPFLKSNDDAPYDEAQAKKDRIKHHRENVRNGPVKYRKVTNGQIRREQARIAKAKIRRTRKRQLHDYFDARSEAASLRGRLQHVGLIAFANHHKPEPALVMRSTISLIQQFADAEGQVEVTEPLVRDALQSALNRYQSLTGVPATQIPADFVLPVRVAA